MTFQKHITNICRSVNIHIRKINGIRRYLSNTAVRTLVQSIVIARLDYCNSVCIGLPMNRLQRFNSYYCIYITCAIIYLFIYFIAKSYTYQKYGIQHRYTIII